MFLSLIFGILAYISIIYSLPKDIKINDKQIIFLSVSKTVDKIIKIDDIINIDFKTIYRRNSFTDIVLQLFLYGVFFIFMDNRYRIMTITDKEMTEYHLYDYSYSEFNKIINILYKRDKNMFKNDIEQIG